MLIGVLAQVDAAVAPFVRPAEPEDSDGVDAAGPVPAQQSRGAGITAKGGVTPQGGGSEHQDDLGVAISRDELGDDDDDDDDGTEDAGASRPQHSSPPPAKQAHIKEKKPEKGESKGKKRSRAEDAGSARLGKPEKPIRLESSKEGKKAKKKKKKKGGDEFDDLFSSLM